MPDDIRSTRELQIARYIKIQNTWFGMHFRYISLHYFLSAAAVVLSVIVASSDAPSKISWLNVKVSLAIITGLLALFGFEKRAYQAQRAWRILNVAITKFLNDDGYTLDRLLSAYEQGEDILHEAQATGKRPCCLKQERPGV